MSPPSAKLEIYRGGNLEREFLLDRDLTDIGRAPENALVLNEPTVSRHHAQIVRKADGYTIADKGSSKGTLLNDIKLQPDKPHPLADSDRIAIDIFELRFCPVAAQEEKTEVYVSSTLPDTVVAAASGASVLRVQTPQGTRNFPLSKDTIVIGRAPNCDIRIDASVISSRHAELRRRSNGYEIVDLGSTNGLLSEGHRIDRKVLADGDVLQIGGEVTLTYELAPATVMPTAVEQLDLRGRTSLSLGRDPQNDTAIDHPAVSRFHAKIVKQAGSWTITDLNSTNGTFVNGKQIDAERVLMAGDTIRIGPCSLVFNVDETLVRKNEQGNLRLDAVHLNKVVAKDVNLLNDISLSIEAREFVVIAGVSGGGKSTLLDALNGFRPATSGTVLVNGTDLYKNFNAYRTELGYVPQKDIVHTELTVEQALDYAARLRMPADTTRAERKKRVAEVIEELRLTHRKDVPVKDLSGGQLKRVSMGVELLTKPSLFFLDEATSGLDPGTELEIMELLRQLADQGRTILLITHATKNVKMCDLVVFLAKGGYVAYFGPPAEAPAYFGVGDFDEIYRLVEREISPEKWQQRYLNSPQYQKYVVRRQQSLQAPATGGQSPRPQKQRPGAKVKRISALGQFLILSERNLAILMRDRSSLILMLAIAPVLGLLDFVTWKRDLFDAGQGDPRQAITMLFTAALIAVMVGSLATMREIVKEQEIYRRERTIGLQLLPYILSKVWVSVVLAMYQAAVFLLFKVLAVDIPGGTEVLAGMYVTLFLATIAGMVMGLLVSAISPNQNVAPLLTIVFLVPQITFGGGMLSVENFGPPGKAINQLTLSKWPFESLVTLTGLGKDVANDQCWQLPEEERKKLSDSEQKKCACIGPRIFKSCQFPGIRGKYNQAVDEPEPEKPQDPGNPPPQPTAPEIPTPEYQQEMDNFRQDINAYNQKVDEYKKAIDSWQEKYSDWKGKYESAIGEAEGTLERFNKDYGRTFNVDVTQHWSSLGLLMAGMFGLLLVVQKRKDVL
ncbi:FHA domain-containing protein [Kamptonema formosum]|uniref:FHA domain-containing protein n=1 Tax=Kamptonema formosum TaxID=331992 RepID=UPI00034A2AC3|nr:FHA domain-containing protein [Oscillatoria sp. PCC 10802]